MGNKINQSASVVLGLALTAMPAKAEAAKTNVYNEAKTAKIELASDMIVGNTHEKVLNVVDFQNPAKNTKSRENLETETEPTPAEKAQAKELVETLFELADYKAMTEYLAKNGDNLSKVVLNEALKVALEKQVLAGKNAHFQEGERAHYASTGNEEREQEARSFKEDHKKEVSTYTSVEFGIKKLLEKKSIPDNADKIGVKNMDPVFAEILENPKFAGTIKNNKELNDLVFAGFSPEFQKRFNELGLKVLVKKYPTKVKIYFVCGTDKNGEIYDVQVGDTRWKEQKYFILKDAKYGEVLARSKSDGKIIEFREISPEQLEQRVIDEDGSIIPSGTIIITKNTNLHGNKVANN